MHYGVANVVYIMEYALWSMHYGVANVVCIME